MRSWSRSRLFASAPAGTTSRQAAIAAVVRPLISRIGFLRIQVAGSLPAETHRPRENSREARRLVLEAVRAAARTGATAAGAARARRAGAGVARARGARARGAGARGARARARDARVRA